MADMSQRTDADVPPLFLRDVREGERTIKTLVVDSTGTGVADQLADGTQMELERVTSPAAVADQFADHTVVVAVDADALRTLEALRDDLRTTVPVVVVGETDRTDSVRTALNHGADRYIRPAELGDESMIADLIELARQYRERQYQIQRGTELQIALENLQEVYYRTDAEGVVTRVTPAVVDLLGWKPAELLGDSVMRVYPDEAERGIVDALQANDGSVDSFEIQLERKDGSLVDIVTSSHFVTDQEGAVIGVEGILRNITERKAAERELREREERLSAIYESSPTAITLSTIDEGEFISVNEAFLEITGYERAEVLGKTVAELGIWAEDDARATFVTEVSENGQAYDREHEFRSKDGEAIYGFISAETVTIDNEAYMLATTLDITERKKSERELQRQNEQLDRFASMISHDLQNPLGIAETYLEFARDTGAEDDFDAVADAINRMDAMIENILTFARAGGTVEETESVAIRELTESAWETVDPSCGSLTIETDGTIVVDRDRFSHVFENLFRNAVRHGSTSSHADVDDTIDKQDRGVTVRVGSDADTLYVADDGPGIDADRRDEVFDHGYTTTEDGTGFGLSIVETIIEAHGFAVSVTESASGGARFEITGVERTP